MSSKNIDGKFMRVSAFEGKSKDGPVVVGMIGNLTADDLSKDNIDYIKSFYGRSGWHHQLRDKYPETIQRRDGVRLDNLLNGYLVIYQ